MCLITEDWPCRVVAFIEVPLDKQVPFALVEPLGEPVFDEDLLRRDNVLPVVLFPAISIRAPAEGGEAREAQINVGVRDMRAWSGADRALTGLGFAGRRGVVQTRAAASAAATAPARPTGTGTGVLGGGWRAAVF